MREKVIIITLVLIVSLFVGCTTNNTKQVSNTQDIEKAGEKIEDNINTFDDLKKAKAAGKPVSEFDKCMIEAQADAKKWEEYISACTDNKLFWQGYKDGIKCVGSGQYGVNPLCDNTNRYNAEVNAYNQCMDNQPEDIKNRITIMDCTVLMKN